MRPEKQREYMMEYLTKEMLEHFPLHDLLEGNPLGSVSFFPSRNVYEFPLLKQTQHLETTVGNQR